MDILQGMSLFEAPPSTAEEPQKNEGVGALETRLWLELHTRQATGLWSGISPTDENKFGQIGMAYFAKQCASLTLAVRCDDPFADQLFLQIHTEIHNRREQLTESTKTLESHIRTEVPEEIATSVAASVKPKKIPLSFSSKLPYLSAFWLSEVDKFIRLLHMTKHVGVLPVATANEYIANVQKDFRRILNLIHSWTYTGVRREDVIAKNQRYQQACERNRIELTDDVINKENRSPMAPDIVSTGLDSDPNPPAETPTP